MLHYLLRVIYGAWAGVGLLWLFSSIIAKPAARRQSIASRLIHIVIVALGFLVLFDSDLWLGPLARRPWPVSLAAAFVGMLLTIAGICFAIAARFFLGRNWSAAITVKRDHQLVRSGPYSIVRHPIYSGFLLALLGTAIAFNRVGGFLGFLLVLIGFRMKSLLEEKFMTEQFGAEYMEYKREVKALIPLLW